jgi:hypothetical protein
MKRTIVARANHSVRTVVAFAFAAFATSISCARLTAKKLFGWDGVWLDNNKILFFSAAAGEKEDAIYRISTVGKNLRHLIKNARFPSVSTL